MLTFRGRGVTAMKGKKKDRGPGRGAKFEQNVLGGREREQVSS